jgi:hypothetical protein
VPVHPSGLSAGGRIRPAGQPHAQLQGVVGGVGQGPHVGEHAAGLHLAGDAVHRPDRRIGQGQAPVRRPGRRPPRPRRRTAAGSGSPRQRGHQIGTVRQGGEGRQAPRRVVRPGRDGARRGLPLLGGERFQFARPRIAASGPGPARRRRRSAATTTAAGAARSSCSPTGRRRRRAAREGRAEAGHWAGGSAGASPRSGCTRTKASQSATVERRAPPAGRLQAAVAPELSLEAVGPAAARASRRPAAA